MTRPRAARRSVLVLAVALLATSCGGGDAASPVSTPGATDPPRASAPEPNASSTRPPSTAPTTATTTGPAPSSTTLAPTTEPAGDLDGRTVVIDPGHNGANGAHPTEISRPVDAGGFTKACNTTGTAAPGLTESAFNWDVAVRLRTLLEARGAAVTLTRPDDAGWGPCVDERGRTAGRVGADVLVSIHADGAAPSGRGFHVISSPASGAGSDALARTLRDDLVADGFAPSTYLGAEGLDERTDLGTLNLSSVPAAMVECGNMANPEDLATFTSPDGRQRIAEALAQGLARFLAP